MIELSPELVTLIMVGGVVLGILSGFLIAIPLVGVALITGYALFGPPVVSILYARVFDFILSYTLLAIPLFVFMGLILERGGLVERMYEALYLWLGGFRGGLALVTILIGTALAAALGITAASLTMLTLVALPSMVKRGYDKSLAAGSICAAGCLGVLIPPSVLLVIYGPMAGISVGKLFMGAFMPGFLLSFLYCVYVSIRSFLEPHMAPSVPVEERRVPFIKKTIMLLTSIAPLFLLIISVLGVIFLGIAPPTEAAAMGATAATLLVIAFRRFSWQVLYETALGTLKTTGMIFLIGSCAFAFTGVFLRAGGDEVVKAFVLGAPGGSWGAFMIIMFIIFIMGFVVDIMAILFIMVPIISPVVPALGFDPIWFAIMVNVNLQTAFMTPPMAFAIFIVKGTADPELGVTMADIIRGVIPFVILILVGLVLCVAFPEIILWLPGKTIK